VSRSLTLSFVATLLFQASLQAQSAPKGTTHPVESRQLSLVERRELKSEVSGMLLLPERCDGDGNLYLRIGADERAIIRKISPDGKRAVAIPKDPIPDAPHPHPGTFNVDEQGNVYQLASVGVQRYVFIFDSDGDLKSKVKLDPGFEWLPGFVAPFTSGALLVSGVRVHLDPGERTRKPFTGIFSADGTLRKEVTLPDDDKLHKLAESGDERLISPSSSVNNRAFSFGSAETAPDGNVYVMRAVDPPLIYGISPGGEVVKKFVVELGDANLSPLEPLHILSSRIAVLFHNDRNGEDIIKIVSTDGEPLAIYGGPAGGNSPGPGLACWTAPDRFEFIGEADDGYLNVNSFEPR
jgi:hypothetical protein